MKNITPPYGLLPNNTKVLWKDGTIHQLDSKGVRCNTPVRHGRIITLVQAIVYLNPEVQWCFTCWGSH